MRIGRTFSELDTNGRAGDGPANVMTDPRSLKVSRDQGCISLELTYPHPRRP